MRSVLCHYRKCFFPQNIYIYIYCWVVASRGSNLGFWVLTVNDNLYIYKFFGGVKKGYFGNVIGYNEKHGCFLVYTRLQSFKISKKVFCRRKLSPVQLEHISRVAVNNVGRYYFLLCISRAWKFQHSFPWQPKI